MMHNNLPEIVKDALAFATDAHKDQKRKNSGQPYIVHPIAVMTKWLELCSDFFAHYHRGDPKTLEFTMNLGMCAALIHDVFEDTDKTVHDFYTAVGYGELQDAILQVAINLTDTAKKLYPYASRDERKAIDGARMASVTLWLFPTLTIKMCDIMCNTSDYGREDPKYAIRYVSEKQKYTKFLVKLPEQFRKMLDEHLSQVKADSYSYCWKHGIKL